MEVCAAAEEWNARDVKSEPRPSSSSSLAVAEVGAERPLTLVDRLQRWTDWRHDSGERGTGDVSSALRRYRLYSAARWKELNGRRSLLTEGGVAK